MHSNWLTIDQPMIDRFADATCDHQFIHVDPERALASAFGGTIAHGFLTLSLLTHLLDTVAEGPLRDDIMSVNYGLDRVRFVSPVQVGSRVRAVLTQIELTEKRPGQFQQVLDVVLQLEGRDNPALVGIWRILKIFAGTTPRPPGPGIRPTA